MAPTLVISNEPTRNNTGYMKLPPHSTSVTAGRQRNRDNHLAAAAIGTYSGDPQLRLVPDCGQDTRPIDLAGVADRPVVPLARIDRQRDPTSVFEMLSSGSTPSVRMAATMGRDVAPETIGHLGAGGRQPAGV